MKHNFAEMLAAGGKTNSLGRVNEVIDIVLEEPSRLKELYGCLFDDDAWVRMRAADAIEKVCRQHPDWLKPYIDRFLTELSSSTQPSIRWHLAQIYRQVPLTSEQVQEVVDWLKALLASSNIDWIVSANAMDTLVQFTKNKAFPSSEMVKLLKIQQTHKSSAVRKRANKYLDALVN